MPIYVRRSASCTSGGQCDVMGIYIYSIVYSEREPGSIYGYDVIQQPMVSIQNVFEQKRM